MTRFYFWQILEEESIMGKHGILGGSLIMGICLLLLLGGCGQQDTVKEKDNNLESVLPEATTDRNDDYMLKQERTKKPAQKSIVSNSVDTLQYTITPMDHSLMDANGQRAIHVVYDLIEVSGAPGADRINTIITGNYHDYFVPSMPELEKYVGGPGSGSLYDYFKASVSYNKNGIFSARLDYEYNFGGVNMYGTCPYNFDITSGADLYLSDVLPNVDEATLVNTAKDRLIDYAEKNRMEYEGVISDIYARFADTYTTSDTLPFYIAEDGECILCFDKYDLTYGAAGEFIVPTGLYVTVE